MQSLNVVHLIEKTTITKLSGSYNNRLLQRIKDHFTDSQQHMFVTSFYCYLNYNQTTEFLIDLDNLWKWLGFSQKSAAKKMLEKHFTLDIDYKVLLYQLDEQTNDGRGGHNKETIMLNIKTFKLFCIKAGTKKADEIHEYFIKLEELLHQAIQEESDELKKQLEHKGNQILDIENRNKEAYAKLLQEKAQERQRVLLQEYNKDISIVYIVKIKTYENGEYIVKIGESRRGITDRFAEHKSKYEESTLLDCFAVNRSKDFESFLHNHEQIKPNQVTNLEGHINERELFRIGRNLTYAMITNIVKNNSKYFDGNSIEQLKLENEKLQLLTDLNGTNVSVFIAELLAINKTILEKVTGLERFISEQSISQKPPTKTTTSFNTPLVTLGPRLQKINPETMQLIKVYETVSECMNENPNIKRPSINKAVAENTIYEGFRWLLVDRELDANTLTTIEITKPTTEKNPGYIAKLNQDKTEILNVYLDRKTASIANGYESSGSLDTPVKQFKISRGNYYLLYDSCSDELKQAFVLKHGEPLLYKDGVGKYDSENHLVRSFACKYDCIRTLRMSDKTLAKALDKNILYNGHYFKTIGSKLQIVQ
jgi:phage anti-repressor protein